MATVLGHNSGINPEIEQPLDRRFPDAVICEGPWNAGPDAGHLQDQANVNVAHGPGLVSDNGPGPVLEFHIQVEWGIRGLHGVWPVKHILLIK